MLRAVLIIGMLALGTSQLPAQALIKFDAVRAQLLAHGYKPVLFKRAPGKASACESHDACSVYPETQACSPTGYAGCEMFYTKGTATIRVTTSGEFVGHMVVKEQKRVERRAITEPHAVMDSQ